MEHSQASYILEIISRGIGRFDECEIRARSAEVHEALHRHFEALLDLEQDAVSFVRH